MFDPWNSSFTEALDRLRAHPNQSFAEDPVFQYLAAERVKSQRSLVEEGNGAVVLYCLRDCLSHRLIAPRWLIREYNRKLALVENTKTWDDVFGKPNKGVHLRNRDRDRKLTPIVFERIEAERATKVPTDAALFERVGADLGIAKTKCEKLYYEELHRTKWTRILRGESR